MHCRAHALAFVSCVVSNTVAFTIFCPHWGGPKLLSAAAGGATAVGARAHMEQPYVSLGTTPSTKTWMNIAVAERCAAVDRFSPVGLVLGTWPIIQIYH